MSKKIVRYVAVIWLSFLLLLGNTPMEFVHLFADHEDTVHKDHHGLVIEKKHHHCAYLSLTLTAFVNDYHVPIIIFSHLQHYANYATLTRGYVQRSIIRSTLRGPPQV